MVAAAIRDVGDHRVLASDERRLEALRGLVVEQPVPPVAGGRLRGGHGRWPPPLGRATYSGRTTIVVGSSWSGGQARSRTSRYVTTGPTSARYGDSTTTSGTPGSCRSQRCRSCSASSSSVVTNTAWSIAGSLARDLPNITACTTERLMPL